MHRLAFTATLASMTLASLSLGAIPGLSQDLTASAASLDDSPNIVLKCTYKSVSGTPVVLPDATAKATALIFVSSTCPIANGYAPEINRMIQKYRSKKIQFLLVHVEKDLSLNDARKHMKEFGYRCDALLDPQRALVKQVNATVTPEAALISPSGKLLYRGRIDDRFPSIGIQRSKARTTELRDAIDSVLAGNPIEISRTEAVGCFIE